MYTLSFPLISMNKKKKTAPVQTNIWILKFQKRKEFRILDIGGDKITKIDFCILMLKSGAMAVFGL